MWGGFYLRIFFLENNITVAWKRNLPKTTAFLEIYNGLLEKQQKVKHRIELDNTNIQEELNIVK